MVYLVLYGLLPHMQALRVGAKVLFKAVGTEGAEDNGQYAR